MAYNIDWVFPRLRHPSAFWHLASTFTIAAVGVFSKLITGFFNRSRVYNIAVLERAIDAKSSANVPLLTVSNHHSCFDDPGIWGVLPLRQICNKNVTRWSLAAHDICFTNRLHSRFFMSGKCIPVVRGAGVHQPAIDVCIEKLAAGDWVHIFPEGKVNVTKETVRFKWGIGRILFETPRMPTIVPIWHEGMDTVLPNTPPYILQFGKKITINVGEPIDLQELVERLRAERSGAEEARKAITDRIQAAMMALKVETERLHAKC